MSVNHKNTPDSQRHEPKGISGAASGEVYVADGSGSGTWQDILADVNNANYTYLFGTITDISTAGSIFIPNGLVPGDIYKIYVCLQGAITVADATVTAKISGVAVTGSSITCSYSGSAGGSVFSSTPSGANAVSAGQAIEIITDGGSTTTAAAIVCIVMDVS